MELETRVYKKWSDGMDGGLRHYAECRRAGMSCFDVRCHIRRGVAELAKQVATAVTCGASSVGITSALPSRSGTDNDRGMPPNPRLGGSGREVKCAAGGAGMVTVSARTVLFIASQAAAQGKRRWSVPNPTTLTPPLGSDPRDPVPCHVYALLAHTPLAALEPSTTTRLQAGVHLHSRPGSAVKCVLGYCGRIRNVRCAEL